MISARQSSRESLAKMRQTGASVLVAEEGGLPFARTGNSLLDPISIIQTAYRFVEATAVARGPQSRQAPASQKSDGDRVMAFALTGARVFDGESIRDGMAVVIDGSRIAEVVCGERSSKGY